MKKRNIFDSTVNNEDSFHFLGSLENQTSRTACHKNGGKDLLCAYHRFG
jgi:hypothetical protein